MKPKISSIIIAISILLFLILAGRYGFTVVRIEDAEQTVKEEAFDPVAYVDSIWESKMLPAFDENSQDLAPILAEMRPDADGNIPNEELIAITEKYGLITVGEAHVYMVKGCGKVVSVDTETSLGTMEIALDGYDGSIKTLIYIGTRIPSDDTSVRDAVGFISFGDFKEQTEYGKVGSEINKHILNTVLHDLDKENLAGKTISFKGAFNIRTFNLLQIDVNEIYIVPMELKLENSDA